MRAPTGSASSPRRRLRVFLCAFGVALVAAGCDRADVRSALERIGILDPWYEREPYRALVAEHARENAELPPDCTVLLGDSLTAAFPEALTRPRGWINRGINGDRVALVQRRLEASALGTPCSRVALLVGVNDLIHDGANPEATAAAIWRTALVLAEAGKRTWVLSLLPVRGEWAVETERIERTNAALMAHAGVEAGVGARVHWLDLGSEFRDGAGALEASTTQDGLHLVAEAYTRWARVLDRALASEQPQAEGGHSPFPDAARTID